MLRGHHLYTIAEEYVVPGSMSGNGLEKEYGQEWCDNLRRVCRLIMHERPEVTIIDGFDAICAGNCRLRKNEICSGVASGDPAEIAKWDREFARRYGVNIGQRYSGQEIVGKLNLEKLRKERDELGY